MCGLAIHVRQKGPVAAGDLQNVLACLAHRGPDFASSESIESGSAEIDLCHTRLSIIDLSPNAHQPFTDPTGRFKIVFNGEIYNYLELRTELSRVGCIFQTDSDTEVLLWAWRVWGDRGLDKLRGMFAFGIVDLIDQTLVVVSDPFGIKPIYFTKSETGWGFASEISALFALTARKRLLNHQVGIEYMLHGTYDRTDKTFFEDVFSLGPGQILFVDFSDKDLKLTSSEWFRKPSTVEEKISWEEAQQRVKQTLRQSVEIHLRSDVGIGVALSGGLDSSALTALVRDIEPEAEVDSFSFVIPGHSSDESFWSNRVAEHLGTVQHLVSPSAKQVGQDIDDVVRNQGEPFGGLSTYAQYAVYREARESGIPVIIDGQGGDELFAGYSGYPEFRLRSLLAEADFAEALRFISDWRAFPGHSPRLALLRLFGTYLPQPLQPMGAKLAGKRKIPSWIRGGVLRELGVHSHRPEIYGYPLSGLQSNRELVKRLADALFSGEMSSHLREGDRNSMRWSVESRVPFLNPDLVKLVLSLPERFLVSESGLTKNVLRHALRDLLPEDVLFRRDKVGFEAPDLNWLKQMAKRPDELLDGLDSIPWINSAAAIRHLNSVWDGTQPYSSQVWRLINISKWTNRNS